MGRFGGIGLVARVELRRSWRALLGLSLLVALVGAVSLAGFAGTRRTASALDRFRDATVARDARVIGADDDLTHRVAEDLRDEPWVREVAEFVDFSVTTDGADVLTIQAGTDDRFGRTVDRPLVLDGRLPADGESTEITVDEVARDAFDLEVGDDLTVTTYDPDDFDCLLTGACPFQGILGPELELQVVGVTRDVDAFARIEDPTPVVTAGAAFTDRYRDQVAAVRSEALVRLDGEGAEDDLRDAVAAVEGVTLITPEDDYAVGAGGAVDVLGTSLLIFSLIAGLAGAFAALQAIARQVDATAATTPVLPALGLTPRGWAAATALPTAASGAVGAVLAGLLAAPASTLFPFGFADRLEPDPGIRVDPLVLGAGVATTAAVLGVGAFALAWRRTRRTGPAQAWAPTLRTASIPLAAGARLAFGHGPDRAAGPMRSAMLGIGLGMVGALAAAFVATSIHTLVDEPDRWGVPWDGVGQTQSPDLFDATVDALGDQDGIAAVATLAEGLLAVDGDEVVAYAFTPVEGELAPTVRRGRLPAADGEIALGESTMDALGVDLGDELPVDDPDGGDDVGLEVVGAVVLPTYGDLLPAQGSLLTPDGLASVTLAEGVPRIVVDYEDGADRDELDERLSDELLIGFLDPILPPQLANLDEAVLVVRALIVFFAVLGVIGLAQALAVSNRRHRRNVAVWRALGFVPGQVRRAVLWQAALVTGVAVAIGVPLGLYVGHVAWRLTIGSVGVVDDPVWPVVPAAVALPLALVGAVLLAALPAWLAGRGSPAAPLRSE